MSREQVKNNLMIGTGMTIGLQAFNKIAKKADIGIAAV